MHVLPTLRNELRIYAGIFMGYEWIPPVERWCNISARMGEIYVGVGSGVMRGAFLFERYEILDRLYT